MGRVSVCFTAGGVEGHYKALTAVLSEGKLVGRTIRVAEDHVQRGWFVFIGLHTFMSQNPIDQNALKRSVLRLAYRGCPRD